MLHHGFLSILCHIHPKTSPKSCLGALEIHRDAGCFVMISYEKAERLILITSFMVALSAGFVGKLRAVCAEIVWDG